MKTLPFASFVLFAYAVGKHPGSIISPKHVYNLAWGDEYGKTLYLRDRDGLSGVRLNIAEGRP
jgi:hypothetical protein